MTLRKITIRNCKSFSFSFPVAPWMSRVSEWKWSGSNIIGGRCDVGAFQFSTTSTHRNVTVAEFDPDVTCFAWNGRHHYIPLSGCHGHVGQRRNKKVKGHCKEYPFQFVQSICRWCTDIPWSAPAIRLFGATLDTSYGDASDRKHCCGRK